MKQGYRWDGGAVGLLSLVALAFWYWRIVAPAEQVLMGGLDLYTQIYPASDLAFSWLRHGHIPLWNPYQYCGVPLLAAVLYGVFYPFNLLFLVLPTELAIECTAVLHLALAGGLMHAYGRVIGLSRPAALVMAMTFMLSGFLVSQAMWFTPAIGAAAWLPLGFIAVEKLFATRTAPWMAVLACVVALPVLAGWLQSWLYAMYAIWGFFGLRLVLLARAPDGRNAIFWLLVLGVGAGLLGVALAAVQLLPTLELQQLTPRRPGGLSIRQILLFGPLPPARLLEEIVNATPAHPRFGYLGVAALLLVPLAWLVREQRLRVAYLSAVATFAVLVAVSAPFITEVFWLLPAARWFRAPARILYLYAFAAAVLCGIGTEAILQQTATSARRRAWLAAAAVGVALAWFATAKMPARSHLYLCSALAIVVGTIVASRPGLRRGLVFVLLGVVTTDLFLASRNTALHPFHRMDLLTAEQPTFDFIRARQGLWRTYVYEPNIFGFDAMAKQGSLQRVYSITDYEPLSLGRYARFYAMLEAQGSTGDNVRPFMGHLVLDPSPDRLRLLSLLSVRYIAVDERVGWFREKLARALWPVVFSSPATRLVVYENPAPMPRAYIAHQAVVVTSGEEALEALKDGKVDLRRAVLIEPEEHPVSLGQGNTPVREATIKSYRPTTVIVEVDSPEPGYLVLTDTFYPGWEAHIDGQPAKILPANYLFRAVPVPAGHHTVTFRYRPKSVAVGAIVTLSALLALVLLCAGSRFRYLRSRRKLVP